MTAEAKRREINGRIENWQAAFRHANGRDAPPVRYTRGWYHIGDEGPYEMKWRASRMEAATVRLLARPPLPATDVDAKIMAFTQFLR